jgi:hypothetical protein
MPIAGAPSDPYPDYKPPPVMLKDSATRKRSQKSEVSQRSSKTSSGGSAGGAPPAGAPVAATREQESLGGPRGGRPGGGREGAGGVGGAVPPAGDEQLPAAPRKPKAPQSQRKATSHAPPKPFVKWVPADDSSHESAMLSAVRGMRGAEQLLTGPIRSPHGAASAS